jgi:hypothetical protein
MHNPLRSEAEVFRVVVVVGIALVSVIVVGLLAGPGWGAGLLAIEIAAGAYMIWRTTRGSEPHTAVVAHDDDGIHRILVVANQTVAGRSLLKEIRHHHIGSDTEILVVVPALPHSRLEHLAHDVDGAIAEARIRLDDSLATMSEAGLTARGTVGDHHDPNAAIEDALATFAADEVIISTHPPERSKWLESGVVERAEAEIPLPVTHVIVDLEAEGETRATEPEGPAALAQ